MAGALRLQILGPLRVWRDGVEVDPGPQQQAYLLALLLANAGRALSTSELVGLMWPDDVPASAANLVQKHVGALRRLLEPALPSRETGSYLRRRGTSYVFDAADGTVDAITFRTLVERARAAQRGEDALDRYVEALALWRGPAGAGFSPGPAAMPVFAGLNDQFLEACSAATELAVPLGRANQVLSALRLGVSMAPLHEGVQASLITVLGAIGQQAEALSTFRAVRGRLVAELGIDPGPTLRTAHQQVLRRALMPAGTTGAALAGQVGAARGADDLVGRSRELSMLRQPVEAALTGDAGLGIVEGEPGVGKTRLLETVAAEAAARGCVVVWGRCLAGDGTPSMWPWVQVVSAVLDSLPAEFRDEWLSGDLGRLVLSREGALAGHVFPADNGAQFRLFDRVVAVVGQVSARQPVILIIDDLQWADVASLQMFGHLAGRLPGGAAMLGALRDRAPVPDSDLSRTLASASRGAGHRRIRVDPLGLDAVAELVRRETSQDLDIEVARSIHTRTSGNPFFVRELSRLLAGGGPLTVDAAARVGVPSTVRDVVHDRIAGLDDTTRDLMRAAALIGRDVDLGLLALTARLEVSVCLDRLEPLAQLGLVEATPGDPFSFRFAHDLVRESVVESTPPRQSRLLHLGIASALDHLDPDGESVAESLAYHLWAAGPLADSARTASALVLAALRAANKCALEAAERQLRLAVQVARTAKLAELELSALSHLVAVVGMRAMYGSAALDLLERAEHLARDLGREREAAGFLFSRWVAHQQGIQLEISGPLARQLLEYGDRSADPLVRAYGLHAWGLHQWNLGQIGTAREYQSRGNRLIDDLTHREDDPVGHDLQLLMTGMLAEITATHGDVVAARALLDKLEAVAGNDPYMITVWATIAARIASIVGDPAWALQAARRGVAVDSEFSFVFLGTYQRLALYWAQALTGDDPAGAVARAERIIEANLLNPPRSCVATWHGLLSEMLLAAGSPREAAAALDRADQELEVYGQRYAEGLIVLQRARVQQALDEPVEVVRATAERARAISLDGEALLFARRAERFLAHLPESPPR